MIQLLPTADVLIPMFVTFIMITTRIGFLFLISPVLSAGPLPKRILLAIIVVVSAAVFIGIPIDRVSELNTIKIIIGIFGEAAIGMAAGLTARLVFAAVDGAGRLLGIPMGLAFSNMVDPMTKVNSVVSSRFLNIVIALIFLAMDGHHVLIRLIAKSFRTLPPGMVIPEPLVGRSINEQAAIIFTGTMQLAAPVLLVLLGVMMAIALLAKVAPKVNIMVLSFAISIGLGLLSLRAALPDLMTWMRDGVARIEPLIVQTLEGI